MTKAKNFKSIIVFFAIVTILGYGICLLSVATTILQSDLKDRPFCLNSECLERFVRAVEPSLAFGKATSDLVVAIATAGGIVIALWSYFNAVNNSALGNHISHFSIFQSYLNSEIEKRNRINVSSIDTFYWYNLIFPNSKSGMMTVSEKYKKTVIEINNQILLSNNLSSTATGESFRYVRHQKDMKENLMAIGITVFMQPRIEYYEAEDQVISLIACINSSFCLEAEIPKLIARKYA